MEEIFGRREKSSEILVFVSCKPTQNTLRKHGISKKLKTRKDIAIVRPGKGSAVVILDRDI